MIFSLFDCLLKRRKYLPNETMACYLSSCGLVLASKNLFAWLQDLLTVYLINSFPLTVDCYERQTNTHCHATTNPVNLLDCVHKNPETSENVSASKSSAHWYLFTIYCILTFMYLTTLSNEWQAQQCQYNSGHHSLLFWVEWIT